MKKYVLILSLAVSLPILSFSKNISENKADTMKVDVVDGQVDVVSNVIYSQITSLRSNRPLKMTLLVPRTKVAKPAIVYFPGGGFQTADYEKYMEMRTALAKAGFVVAAAEYRTIPDKYPALVVDAKSAVRYLRAHAEQLGIDPDCIGVLGDSAGGYVAQMTGATNGEKEFDKGDYLDQSSEVQAVATMYGISNLLNIGAGFSKRSQEVHASPAVPEALLLNGVAFRNFPGESVLADPKKALAASSMGHIKKGMPPFLIMHGTADNHVSPVQSEQLYKALVEKGNKVEYVVVEGAGHGDVVWYQKPIIDRVVNWFKANLFK